jgi:hypothetical protein
MDDEWTMLVTILGIDSLSPRSRCSLDASPMSATASSGVQSPLPVAVLPLIPRPGKTGRDLPEEGEWA